MKKKKIITTLLIGIVILATIAWNKFSDYSIILKMNWNFELPSDSHYSEIYSRDSGPSFHGDGIRYHIFSYKEKEPINDIFTWQSTEQKTKCYNSYSEATNQWLNQINVPTEKRPNYTECVYWHQLQDDNSEIIIFWDKTQSKLYIAEEFI